MMRLFNKHFFGKAGKLQRLADARNQNQDLFLEILRLDFERWDRMIFMHSKYEADLIARGFYAITDHYGKQIVDEVGVGTWGRLPGCILYHPKHNIWVNMVNNYQLMAIKHTIFILTLLNGDVYDVFELFDVTCNRLLMLITRYETQYEQDVAREVNLTKFITPTTEA